MCILSGCDYLENISGIGLKTAKKFIANVKKGDVEEVS
jgi:5'-3' exonuclease